MPVAAKARPTLTVASRPLLARHARLKHDEKRGRWVILVPERVLLPDDTAVEVLQLTDGERTIDGIVAELATKYVADPGMIRTDVLTLLQDLADKGYVVESGS
jgi:pyrroloquinoline quinone biosynthesis protein D